MEEKIYDLANGKSVKLLSKGIDGLSCSHCYFRDLLGDCSKKGDSFKDGLNKSCGDGYFAITDKEPSVKSSYTLETGDIVFIRPEKEINSCNGCCFSINDECTKEKYGFNFQCYNGGVIFEGKLSNIEKESSPSCDNPFLDEDFDLDKGGVVRGVVEKFFNSCEGCYFHHKDGRVCAKDSLLSTNPNCDGIIFELIEDPPSECDVFVDKEFRVAGGVVTSQKNVYNTCDGCYFKVSFGCTKPSDFPACHKMIFTNFLADHPHPTVEDEEEEEVLDGKDPYTDTEEGKKIKLLDGSYVISETSNGSCVGCCFLIDGECTANDEIGHDESCYCLIFKRLSDAKSVSDGSHGLEFRSLSKMDL